MRLNQFVATASGLSRRAADQAISDGRVHVDGAPAKIGQIVELSSRIELDGQPLAQPTSYRYIMLNKPAGYVSSRRQQGSVPTLYDLLPSHYHNLRIVGRLDQDSSGLVLLTDDGAFIQQHTHPSYQKDKQYRLRLTRAVKPDDLRRLESGVELSDGPSRVSVESINGRTVIVSLHEGRNRQLRRMFGALGYTVEKLERLAMGSYQLGELEPGRWQTVEKTTI